MLKIALTHQKGGVGKTTSVLNIAASLALAGKRVLMIDMDGQQNLSEVYQLNDQEENIYSFLTGTGDLPTRDVANNLTLVPGSELMHTLDVYVQQNKLAAPGLLLEHRLNEFALEESIDVVILDCPPKTDYNTINALCYAEWAFIPVMADKFSVKGVKKTMTSIETIRKSANKKLKVGGIFFVRYDPRPILYSQVRSTLENSYGDKVMEYYTRENVALREAIVKNMDIFSYDKEMERTSNGAIDYTNIAKEILFITANVQVPA